MCKLVFKWKSDKIQNLKVIFIEIFLVLIFGSFPILEFKFSHFENYLWFLIKWTLKIFHSFTFHKSGHKILSRDTARLWQILWQIMYHRNTWYVASLLESSVADYGLGWYLPLAWSIYQMVQNILPVLRKVPVTNFWLEKSIFEWFV